MTASALRIATHAALLTAPLLLLGRFEALARPQAIACVAAMLMLGEVELSAASRGDPVAARAPGARLALASALGLLVTAWAAIGSPSLAPSWSSAWTWLGLPAVLGGAALRASAIRTLGASFTSETVATPGRALVTRGIYARMRHPSDAGLLLVALGLALLGSSVSALLVAALVVAPSVIARVASEEQILAASHGEAHAAYRHRVGLWWSGGHRSPARSPGVRFAARHSRTSVPNASGT